MLLTYMFNYFMETYINHVLILQQIHVDLHPAKMMLNVLMKEKDSDVSVQLVLWDQLVLNVSRELYYVTYDIPNC